MLYYVLIGLSLVLTGVAGLQMAYMFYLDRLDKDRKKRLRQLERRCKNLALRLEQAESKIEELNVVLELHNQDQTDEEQWADVIDDR